MDVWALALAAEEQVSSNTQIWVTLITVVGGIVTLVISLYRDKNKPVKSGINGDPETEPASPEPKPPTLKSNGELDEIASFLDMYDSVKRLYRERQKDSETIRAQGDELLTLKIEFRHLQERFSTGVRQILTWATHLEGKPPHDVPSWVLEIVESAKNSELKRGG